MPIGLVIPEIPNPNPILKESFSGSFSLITLIPALILKPWTFIHPHKGLVNFILALGDLREGVLGAEAMEHAVLELTLVADLAVGVREFAVAVHEVVFPLAAVGLAVGQGV